MDIHFEIYFPIYMQYQPMGLKNNQCHMINKITPIYFASLMQTLPWSGHQHLPCCVSGSGTHSRPLSGWVFDWARGRQPKQNVWPDLIWNGNGLLAAAEPPLLGEYHLHPEIQSSPIYRTCQRGFKRDEVDGVRYCFSGIINPTISLCNSHQNSNQNYLMP